MNTLPWKAILANAVSFAARWHNAAKEEAEAQPFTLDFIRIFGDIDPLEAGEFEAKVALDDGHIGYIDYFWPKQIAIEMKSPGKNLKKAYEQLKDYVVHLPPETMPQLLMVSDFANIHLYHRTSGTRIAFKLKDLRRHIREFAALAGYELARIPEVQLQVNVQAAEKMAALHDALLEYGYTGHNLELYLVRLLFCLFAEDTGIFPQDAFLDYVRNAKADGSDLASRLARLFEVLDMPEAARKKRILLTPTLLQFQYINGKLFAELLPQADFDAKMRQILIECAEFDWSKISPAIFGSIFQGVMDKQRRRQLGAHYTSEENILKLINPLFMDDLWAEFHRIKTSPAKLQEFHKKIASLKFLDPACGCGNFLIIAYRELRKLELAILKMTRESAVRQLNIANLLKVNVNQFYGIEIEEFPAQIAQVGMWLMDHQMNMETSDLFGDYYARLPLTQSATIKNANALTVDWLEIVPGEEISFIIGNPPFSGARVMNKEQKQELNTIFGDLKNSGDLDFVTCWFKKADELMKSFNHVKTAFVASNSIVQGIHPSVLWKPILAGGSYINFAYRSFKWDNEAKGIATVFCVIIGFSRHKCKNIIFDETSKIVAANINAYLIDANNIYVESRNRQLYDVPNIGIGNKPVDGGNFLFTAEEKIKFLQNEPRAERYFHKWMGADEFINNKVRYCLYLANVDPKTLNELPNCLKIVKAVREFRLKSNSIPTKRLADRPTHFHVNNIVTNDFLVIPKVLSASRTYLPIGFLHKDILASDLLHVMKDGNMYHFGILSSSLHSAWVRAVAGRLGNSCRYSRDIVYNNFPWPEADDKQKSRIEALGQKILDTRSQYPDCTLADLYNPLTMPRDLLKAHRELDRAVLRLYGLPTSTRESDIVARLFELYKAKVEGLAESL